MSPRLILASTFDGFAPAKSKRCREYRRIGYAADPNRRPIVRPLTLARCFAQRRGCALMPDLGRARRLAALRLVGLGFQI